MIFSNSASVNNEGVPPPKYILLNASENSFFLSLISSQIALVKVDLFDKFVEK